MQKVITVGSVQYVTRGRAEITTQTSCVCKHFLSPVEEEKGGGQQAREHKCRNRLLQRLLDHRSFMDQKGVLKQL